LVAITRPLNVIIAACTVLIGALLTGKISPVRNILFAALSAGFICAAGNALNDYFDVEIDRINKPNRPIPAGKITRKSVLLCFFILTVIGISIAPFIALKAFALAFTAVVLLILYNVYLKRKTGLLGNVTVSFTAALTIIYGGLAVGRIEKTLFPALFAFLIHTGREIIKDIEDVTGDRHLRLRSIPTRYSLKTSYYFGFIPLFLLIIVVPLPYIYGVYNFFYIVLVIPFVDILLLFSFFYFRNKLDTGSLHSLNNVIKLTMVFGLISLVIGII